MTDQDVQQLQIHQAIEMLYEKMQQYANETSSISSDIESGMLILDMRDLTWTLQFQSIDSKTNVYRSITCACHHK